MSFMHYIIRFSPKVGFVGVAWTTAGLPGPHRRDENDPRNITNLILRGDENGTGNITNLILRGDENDPET
jgi:hypothetical protein